MVSTNFQKLIDLLEKALVDLKSSASQDFIESTAILIHEAMSGSHRKYHTVDHIFQVLDPRRDPILVLTALFHDIVYYNVDDGFTEPIKALLEPYTTIELNQIFIRRRGPKNDLVLPLVNQVFGFNYGQLLTPSMGMNEYLSALTFASLFIDILSIREVIGVVAAIEGSIPFRGPNNEGLSSFQLLEARLVKVNDLRLFNLQKAEIEKAVMGSVTFANLDIGNFAYEKVELFLEQSWKLFPENNIALSQNTMYSVRDYRRALEKMASLFSSIEFDNIFHQYKNTPSTKELKALSERARRNSLQAKRYFELRLIAVGAIEALCQMTGGDLPLNMILGNTAASNDVPQYEFLAGLEKMSFKRAKDIDERFLHLLHFEDNGLASIQKRKITFSSVVYNCLGEKKSHDVFKQVQQFFSKEIPAEAFLECLDPQLVIGLLTTASDMISTRRTRFLNLIKRFDKKAA